jgi:hypothetical protein
MTLNSLENGARLDLIFSKLRKSMVNRRGGWSCLFIPSSIDERSEPKSRVTMSVAGLIALLSWVIVLKQKFFVVPRTFYEFGNVFPGGTK